MRPWIKFTTPVGGQSPSYTEIKAALTANGYIVLESAFTTPIRSNIYEVFNVENTKFSSTRMAEYGRAMDMVEKYESGLIAIQSWRGPIYIKVDRDRLNDVEEHLRDITGCTDAIAEYIPDKQMKQHIKNIFDII